MHTCRRALQIVQLALAAVCVCVCVMLSCSRVLLPRVGHRDRMNVLLSYSTRGSLGPLS